MAPSTTAHAFDASRYPRVYGPSLANRLTWICFGCLLAACGTWGVWRSYAAGDELGPNGPAIIVSLSLVLAALGGYLMLYMGFSRIILRPDAVEVRNLLSKETMLREEIMAWRLAVNTGTIELTPRDLSKKKFKIPFSAKPDALFTRWFESIPNSAVEESKNQNEGPTASIEGTRDSAQAKGQINAAVRKPIVASLVALFGILGGVRSYRLLDSDWVMVVALILFLGPMAIHVFFGARKQLTRHIVRIKTAYIGGTVGIVILAAIVLLNGILDKKPSSQVQTQVVRKSVTTGRSGTTYALFVSPSWRIGRVEERLVIDGATFSKLQIGEPVRVMTHPGALSLPWYSDILPDR